MCNLSTQAQSGTRGLEVQNHPLLQNELKASLSSMRSHLKRGLGLEGPRIEREVKKTSLKQEIALSR